MERVSIDGRSYSDPDVLSLIRGRSGSVDPRKEVIRRARDLNARLRLFGAIEDPRERLHILGSLAGVTIKAMAAGGGIARRREALIYQDHDGRRFSFYDPTLNDGRVNFSIAHEIAHTFFPNSGSGARFRNLHSEDSKEANELERLCDLGASELLMPQEEFLDATHGEMGLHLVASLASRFGSSFEATVFRLATAFEGTAVAGLLQYRLRKEEARAAAKCDQQLLFEADPRRSKKEPVPRYRRQSFHTSSKCGPKHLVPWNKSFDSGSCINSVLGSEVAVGMETLPTKARQRGFLEACRAPFQREGSDPDHPDMLFLWWQ